jgi:DNA-binding LacI/PurR family transcriptional regulator
MSAPDARPITLLDVARAAGVSRTTVSNAFNRPDQLSAELRAKILAVAEGLGYPGPNPIARVLRTGRTNTIGIVFPDPLPYVFTDPAAIALLQGVAAACGPSRTGVLILPADAPRAMAARVREAVVDGFLVYCDEADSPILEALAARALPTVGVDLEGFTLGPAVNVDDRGGAAAAARHLLRLGHRDLAVMALASVPEVREGESRRVAARFKPVRHRLAGYRDAMIEAGLDHRALRVAEEPQNDPAAAEVVAMRLLRRRPRPTAILAMSDMLAIGALRAAQRLGLVVPDELSVVGFDDVPIAVDLTPPLTTVRQPLIEKGRLAAAVLLGQAEPPQASLPTELVLRGTTAAPQPTRAKRR